MHVLYDDFFNIDLVLYYYSVAMHHVTAGRRRLSLFWRTLWNSHDGREKKTVKSIQMFSTIRDLELGRVLDLLIVISF